MIRLSACIITFNEERNLARALESIQGIADEIVVVDCGSRDRTGEIAREHGARVITNAWTNFAEQKNIAAAAANNDWILSLDADEELSRELRGSMLTWKHKEPEFAEMFIAYLLSRNIRIEEDLVDQLFNSSEKRLARLLLLLANFGKEGTPQPIAAHVSQETLAEMIGTTRSRVSFFMNKFRKLGFITYNGKIEVHSSLLNAVLYDKPEIKRDE